ncbi:glycosyltransferase [Nibribacter koreensis]|uniref:Glycosyltransferase n=1 Tax=Nibribacter koreensis TaxID=1084519 RepID=A0ABP8F701_9BACT
MHFLIELLSDFFSYGILVYAITLAGSYLFLAAVSGLEMVYYKRKNSFAEYRAILTSPLAPSVSLIAPAYNEGLTIVDNVRSLLSLHYSNFEVIIVNDGSKDDTLQKMIDVYELEKVEFAVHERLATKPIRGVYKSTNNAYSKLVVVDKVNGGKADALNVGINVSAQRLITCIDVDCVLDQNSILKMVKPFIETEHPTIATGGVIRIANSCEIEDGRLVKVHAPESFLARIQVLEYTRAFLLGRMGWSRIDGLLLISGAFGLFDKEVVIAAGGYNHNTVGEDMELIVRMRRYMKERKLKYHVHFIPDPLCWTEAPASLKILGRQRNRWTRGTIETLLYHKKMFFNPRYGVLGLVSYPYWFFFEWLAPLIEAGGLLYLLLAAIMGWLNWPFFLLLLVSVYTFAVMVSFMAILFDELSYYQYSDRKDIFKLMGTALLEPFVYHPMTVRWALLGNRDMITGKKSWGEMTRTGFAAKKAA